MSYMVSEGRMRLSSPKGRSVRMVLFLLLFPAGQAAAALVLERGGGIEGPT